jgi:hypothetical protein
MKLALAIVLTVFTATAAIAGPANGGYKGDRPCSQGRLC